MESQTPIQSPTPEPAPTRRVMVTVPKTLNEGRGVRAIGRHFSPGQTAVDITEAQHKELLERTSMGLGVFFLPEGYVDESQPIPGLPMTEEQLRAAQAKLEADSRALVAERDRLHQARGGVPPSSSARGASSAPPTDPAVPPSPPEAPGGDGDGKGGKAKVR